ncbi:MAG: four helix bundle protein [Verrucomicrobiota bacterium]
MTDYGYRNLTVWQKAKALAVEICRLTKAETIRHDYSMIDELRRSAVSVPSNIAEGDERKSDKDSIRCYHIAKGSLAELSTQLEIARDVGYFTATEVAPLIVQCEELGKMPGALIRSRNNSSPRAQNPRPRA